MSPSKGGRIHLLDGWRALTVAVMVVWHLLWDMSELFGMLPDGLMQRPLLELVRYYIVFSFLLLAGIACHFSRSNLRRGVQTAVCAGVITVATVIFGDPVKFGILHLLSVCMLLYAALGKYINKIPDIPAMVLFLAAFCGLWLWLDGYRVSFDWLFPLGIRSVYFTSGDYYPLLPWLFLFLAGTVLGRRVQRSDGAWKQVELPRWATFLGRHALFIYMIHQPLLYGVLWLVS